jgi:uncharacterized OsmC-like protein
MHRRFSSKKVDNAMDNLRFRARLRWDGESGGEVSTGRFRGLKLDMPIKFGGKGRYICPDELFLSSVAGCLLTTFLYFRKRFDVHLKGFEISINGTLHARSDGYKMSEIKATIFAKTKKNDEVGVRRCIKLAEEYCHITRTLEKTVPIKFIERIKVVK